jgi:hypothetical protein
LGKVVLSRNSESTPSQPIGSFIHVPTKYLSLPVLKNENIEESLLMPANRNLRVMELILEFENKRV